MELRLHHTMGFDESHVGVHRERTAVDCQ